MKKIIFVLLVLFALSACAPQTGTLTMKITDKENLNIEKAVLTVSQVQVHLAGGENESGWQTVVESPQTFDLVSIKDVKVFFGQAQLMPGQYTQIRLSIDEARVTVDSVEYDLEVPSEKLKLNKNFDIKAGYETVLILDFDAAESVHRTGQDEYILRPTIRVIEEGFEEQLCTDETTGASMSYEEAVAIASSSDCVADGPLQGNVFCNSNTGTWWMDLDIEKEGCSPACVINVNDGAAEINWRCTGLIS